jgi:hypothetical protein
MLELQQRQSRNALRHKGLLFGGELYGSLHNAVRLQ